MQTFIIKKISLSNLAELQKIGRETFAQTFSQDNSPEEMAKYLDKKFSVEKLTEELQNPDSEFYFAEKNGRVAGYLKLNSGAAQTEEMEGTGLEIERIYVLKEFHWQKVGQVLFEKAVELAKKKDADYLWLGVWEKNERAINFYKKNGFSEAGSHIFKLGDEEQTDLIMRLNIPKN
mgnify:CR=1 FL=1